jgi:hypothetical protein
MYDEENNPKELIDLDLDWLKKELEGLTIEQRCLILDEYVKRMKGCGIGITEYMAFVEAFNELED